MEKTTSEVIDSTNETAEKAYRWPPAEGEVIPSDATHIIVEPHSYLSVPRLHFFKQLKHVDIAPSTKFLSRNLFACCQCLEEIYIPDTVEEMEDCAFFSCVALRKVRLPNNENFHKIPDGCFAECSNLTSVEIPPTLREFGFAAFSQCESLKQVTLPDSVTKIGDMTFAKCLSLQKVQLPSNAVQFDISSIASSSVCGGSHSLCSIPKPPDMPHQTWKQVIQMVNRDMSGGFFSSPLYNATGGLSEENGQLAFRANIPVKLWPKLYASCPTKKVKDTFDTLVFQHLRKNAGLLMDNRMRRARRRPRRLGFE